MIRENSSGGNIRENNLKDKLREREKRYKNDTYVPDTKRTGIVERSEIITPRVKAYTTDWRSVPLAYTDLLGSRDMDNLYDTITNYKRESVEILCGHCSMLLIPGKGQVSDRMLRAGESL